MMCSSKNLSSIFMRNTKKEKRTIKMTFKKDDMPGKKMMKNSVFARHLNNGFF